MPVTKSRTEQIDPQALAVLAQMVVADNIAYISLGGEVAGPKKPMPRLDRHVYVAVNEVLDAIGGKWNRAKQGHVFDFDPRDELEQVVLTGVFSRTKVDFQQFDTPITLAARIAKHVCDRPRVRRVLEPSAGKGRIVDAIAAHGALLSNMVMVEQDQKRAAVLQERYGAEGALVYCGDFLDFGTTELFDAVAMNPPFTRRQDVAHVEHAYKLLRAGGRLASVMSAGVTFRQDRRYANFRSFVKGISGEIEELPPGTFAEAGTTVNTVLVTLDKPE